MRDDRLELPADLPSAATPIPVERFVGRRGFSPVQSTVMKLDPPPDASTLPGPATDPLDGVVQLWDLDEGTQLPCFAELDGWESVTYTPVLLVRPMRPFVVGHRIAVVVTAEAKDADGVPLSSPDWFAAVKEGRPAEGLDGYVSLVDELAGLGMADPVLATAFPVDDGTRPLRAMLDTLATPSSFTFEAPDDVDDGADLPEGTWRRVVGRFATDAWLVDDTAFALDEDGLPVPSTPQEARLYVHFPDSVRDAAPGSVPVWVFGHGIFSEPERYLGLPDDPSAVVELADRAGAIVIATVWRGLTYDDLPVPLAVGQDVGRFPELTDKLAQGVAHTAALVRAAVDGRLLDDPIFLGLPDKQTLRYYGISLGGIEGAVLMAVEPRVPHGVLHVGGSTWSTMLERSTHWNLFEPLLTGSGLDDPAERQLVYSLSQLFWDPVDPALYAGDLADRSALWQVAVGDDQVPNLTTYTLARGVGAPVLQPASEAPWGLGQTTSGSAGPAVALFDPQLGNDEASNRPARDTLAHETPRLWEAAKAQTLRFLATDDPGVVEHFCGAGPCTPDAHGGP